MDDEFDQDQHAMALGSPESLQEMEVDPHKLFKINQGSLADISPNMIP